MKKPDFKTFIRNYIRPYHFREVAFSQDIPWYIENFGVSLGKDIKEGRNINKAQDFVKILNCLYNLYPESSVYKLFSRAEFIQENYWPKIEKRVKKRIFKEGEDSGYFNGYEMTETEVFRELVARNFIPINLYSKYHKYKDSRYFIIGNVGNLIYPRKFKTWLRCYAKFENIAVHGFTGIKQPGLTA